MSLVIKNTPADTDTAIMLIRELSTELGKLYDSDGSASFTPADVAIPRSGFVVAWLDELAVGCGAIRPTDDPKVAEIKRMYVRKIARGKGISRQILAALEDIAKDHSYEVIILETGIYQTAAIGLYENVGYQRTACYGEYVDSPHSICYEKIMR